MHHLLVSRQVEAKMRSRLSYVDCKTPFGDQHREGGVDALPHFGFRQGEGNPAIFFQAPKALGRERHRPLRQHTNKGMPTIRLPPNDNSDLRNARQLALLYFFRSCVHASQAPAA